MIELIAGVLGTPLYPIIPTYRLRLLIFVGVVALLLPGAGVVVVAVLLLPELHLVLKSTVNVNTEFSHFDLIKIPVLPRELWSECCCFIYF